MYFAPFIFLLHDACSLQLRHVKPSVRVSGCDNRS